jgi:hypothetical protein
MGFLSFRYLSEGVIDSKLQSKGNKLFNVIYGCSGKTGNPETPELLGKEDSSAEKKSLKMSIKNMGTYTLFIKNLKDILTSKNSDEIKDEDKSEFGTWKFTDEDDYDLFRKNDESIWIARDGNNVEIMYTIGRDDNPFVVVDVPKDEQQDSSMGMGEEPMQKEEPQQETPQEPVQDQK